MMTLLENWREVAAKAWSVRLILLAGLLSGIEVAMPQITSFFDVLDIFPPGSMAVLSALVSAAALIARLLAQPETSIESTADDVDEDYP